MEPGEYAEFCALSLMFSLVVQIHLLDSRTSARCLARPALIFCLCASSQASNVVGAGSLLDRQEHFPAAFTPKLHFAYSGQAGSAVKTRHPMSTRS